MYLSNNLEPFARQSHPSPQSRQRLRIEKALRGKEGEGGIWKDEGGEKTQEIIEKKIERIEIETGEGVEIEESFIKTAEAGQIPKWFHPLRARFRFQC